MGAVIARSRGLAGGTLRRALALLLLCTLTAPVSHAALSSTSATIRVVASSVGAHTFSASVRATAGAGVGTVSWVVWETAACSSTPGAVTVQARVDCNNVPLDTAHSGQVDLVRPAACCDACAPRLTRLAQKMLWSAVEVRAGPGLLSQTNYTLFLSDASNVIGASWPQ